MRDDFDTEDYEVGYRKPPKSGQFEKGVSGNPSGRPKRAPDFASQIHDELNSTFPIIEKGKRKVITKAQGMAKQLVNKAVVSGNLKAMSMVIPHYQEALGKVPGQQRSSSLNPVLEVLQTMDPKDLTDEELIFIIEASHEKEIRAELEKSIGAKLEKSIRAELKKSMRAELEQSIRAELEKSISAEIDASVRNGADGRRPRNGRKTAFATR